MNKLTEFVIDRSKWARGKSGASLLMKDGRMCCLGIAAKACGVSDGIIYEVGEPGEMLDNSISESRTYFNKLPFLGEVTVSYDMLMEYCVDHGLIDPWGNPEDIDFDSIPEADQDPLHCASQTTDCETLMTTNDDDSISDEVREQKITEVFARHGVTVTFTGE